jgi:hypothetical protein
MMLSLILVESCRDKNMPQILFVPLRRKDPLGVAIAALFGVHPPLTAYRACNGLATFPKLKLMMAASYLVIALMYLHFTQCFDVPDRVLGQCSCRFLQPI